MTKTGMQNYDAHRLQQKTLNCFEKTFTVVLKCIIINIRGHYFVINMNSWWNSSQRSILTYKSKTTFVLDGATLKKDEGGRKADVVLAHARDDRRQ